MSEIVLSLLIGLLAGAAAAAAVTALVRKPQKPDTGINILQSQIHALDARMTSGLSRAMELMGQQVTSVTQNLQTTTGQINARLDQASQVVQNVSRQLGSLSEATQQIFDVTKNISSLEEILKPPKLRGQVGELLLANILREILPSSEFYALQHRFKNGEIVDAVIKLKDGCIPIDSKFPLDNFRRMIETPPGQDAAPARREFIRNVKKHIDDVAKKYILPDEGTLPFALMYIPAENVYYEIIVRPDKATEGVSNGTDPADIYSYATVRHVFPVSPNSLYPYLMTLSLGFRGLRIEERSREILDHLARVYGDLERFRKDFSVVGSHISDAAKKFSDAEKRLDRVSDKLVALREGESEETPHLPSPSPKAKLANGGPQGGEE